jgi:hypothetical protein
MHGNRNFIHHNAAANKNMPSKNVALPLRRNVGGRNNTLELKIYARIFVVVK